MQTSVMYHQIHVCMYTHSSIKTDIMEPNNYKTDITASCMLLAQACYFFT